jgi:hypothetical protein
MSHELMVTSAPRGLMPGSMGFCMVAMTPQLPSILQQRLETISSYRHVFSPMDAKARLNPVCYQYLRLQAGGKTYSVLSRIADAGLDYTERTNKFGHHVALLPQERLVAGPAAMMLGTECFSTKWTGEPRQLSKDRAMRAMPIQPGIAKNWKSSTGDAGWAGVLAEAFQTNPQEPIYLEYPVGSEILPLVAEALALLPDDQRWEVTFSTYYQGLPPDVSCVWRAVLADSPEAKQASARNARVIAVQKGNISPQNGPLVQWARTGERPDLIETVLAHSDDYPYSLSPVIPNSNYGYETNLVATISNKRSSHESFVTQSLTSNMSLPIWLLAGSLIGLIVISFTIAFFYFSFHNTPDLQAIITKSDTRIIVDAVNKNNNLLSIDDLLKEKFGDNVNNIEAICKYVIIRINHTYRSLLDIHLNWLSNSKLYISWCSDLLTRSLTNVSYIFNESIYNNSHYIRNSINKFVIPISLNKLATTKTKRLILGNYGAIKNIVFLDKSTLKRYIIDYPNHQAIEIKKMHINGIDYVNLATITLDLEKNLIFQINDIPDQNTIDELLDFLYLRIIKIIDSNCNICFLSFYNLLEESGPLIIRIKSSELDNWISGSKKLVSREVKLHILDGRKNDLDNIYRNIDSKLRSIYNSEASLYFKFDNTCYSAIGNEKMAEQWKKYFSITLTPFVNVDQDKLSVPTVKMIVSYTQERLDELFPINNAMSKKEQAQVNASRDNYISNVNFNKPTIININNIELMATVKGIHLVMWRITNGKNDFMPKRTNRLPAPAPVPNPKD